MRTRDRRSRGDGPAWPVGRCHGRDGVSAPRRDWGGPAGSAARRGCGAAVARGCPDKPGLARGRPAARLVARLGWRSFPAAAPRARLRPERGRLGGCFV